MKRDAKKFFTTLFDTIGYSDEERKIAMAKIKNDLEVPVKIIGIGQTGVGKTELLKSIFHITDNDITKLKEHRTDATKSATKEFSSLTIGTRNGFKVQLTDGPGLGEDQESDEKYIPAWINEIPNHDLLYWVLDAASRDISHIQQNMKDILDATGFRDRFVLVLNKVDNIQLEEVDRKKTSSPWNSRFNQPTKLLLGQIERRTADIVSKFEKAVGVKQKQIVACSALKRWQHDVVLDKMLELLPKEKRIKAAENRDVKSSTELMDPDVRRALESERGD